MDNRKLASLVGFSLAAFDPDQVGEDLTPLLMGDVEEMTPDLAKKALTFFDTERQFPHNSDLFFEWHEFDEALRALASTA